MAQGTPVTCEARETQIALLVEGDLEAAERVELEGHLASCAACRSFAEDLAHSQESLKSLGGVELEPGALAEIRYRVRASLQNPRRSAVRGWALTAAAAVAAVALLIARRSPTVETPSDPIVEATRTKEPTATAAASASGDVTPPRSTSPSVARDVSPSTPGVAARRAPGSARHTQGSAISVERLPVAPDGVSPDGAPPAVVKVKTSDPDVVIYWVEDSNGGPS